MRKAALFGFSCLFAVETLVNRGITLSPMQWVMLAFAASMIGRASAYLSVLEWFRAPFAKLVPHSSGAGEDYHPRWHDGARSAVAELICCPVCAGAWGATIILTLFKLDPAWGNTVLITLSAAAGAWLISYMTEYIEWHTHLARERTGLANRQNRAQTESDTTFYNDVLNVAEHMLERQR